MTLPHASPEDVQGQQQAVVDEPAGLDGSLPDDAPEADVAEQRVEVGYQDEDEHEDEHENQDAPIG